MFTYTKKYLMPDWWKEKEMKRYPLIERCGLSAVNGSTFIPADEYYVRADELEKFLEGATVVYGKKFKDGQIHFSSAIKTSLDTHTARLVMIEPIENKCEHENIIQYPDHYECCDCSQKLKPIGWEPVE